jgi:transcriptional antiterminator Rof (Rho-off)
MTDDTEAAALRAWLEVIVKEAEDVEAQAATAHRRVQAACLLLEEEESKATALEQTATAARQRVPPSSSPAVAS